MVVKRNAAPPKTVVDDGIIGLKKGPWMAAEDRILMEYVKKRGEGNWNAVRRNTGLARCGKSCRLRWANHLRPNLKKGSFSAAEERVIIELHSKLGNKWATMAAQLPGRTDNEIKNYWNTRMKRRQRAGLPLYPLELQKEDASIHLQHPIQGETYYSSPPISSILSPQSPSFNHPLSLFNPMNFSLAVNSVSSNQHDSAFFSSPTSQFQLLRKDDGASRFSIPISSALNSNGGRSNFDCDSDLSSMILGSSFEEMVPGLDAELPSIQTSALSTTTASSGNSGLLDALLMEAQAMARNEKLKDYGSSLAASEKEEQVGEEDAVEIHSDEFSSSQSSTMGGVTEETELTDEDLMSLLHNFPSTMPRPWPAEWYPNMGGDTVEVQASNLPPTSLAMVGWENADSTGSNHIPKNTREKT